MYLYVFVENLFSLRQVSQADRTLLKLDFLTLKRKGSPKGVEFDP
jgi:hypothetical protein